jgi:hypothetical protein
MMKNLRKQMSNHEDHFSKTLFALFWCRIAEDDGSGDLLSRLRMHVDEQDEVALTAQQWKRRKPICIGSWLFVVTSSMVTARIYREDPPRVTSSHN